MTPAAINLQGGRFICLEGIDGAGKSTVAAALVHRLRRAGVEALLVSRRSRPTANLLAAERLDCIARMLWEYPGEAPIRELGDRHLIMLMASWYHLLNESVVRPALAQGRLVIADQWVAKYIARFRAMGGLEVEELFAGLAQPGAVFLLELPPEVACARKPFVKATECGAHASGDHEKFVSFQLSVQEELRKHSDASWHFIDASKGLEEVVEDAARLLARDGEIREHAKRRHFPAAGHATARSFSTNQIEKGAP